MKLINWFNLQDLYTKFLIVTFVVGFALLLLNSPRGGVDVPDDLANAVDNAAREALAGH